MNVLQLAPLEESSATRIHVALRFEPELTVIPETRPKIHFRELEEPRGALAQPHPVSPYEPRIASPSR